METFEYFRIGPGYVKYWIHETTHWDISEAESVAIHELEEAFFRLIRKRNQVQDARRSFAPASSLPVDEGPSPAVQKKLFDETHDFFQTFYSTLSAFAAVAVRFRKELGNAPHRSNAKFLDWLSPLALQSETAIPLLQEARQFRALIDHRAGHSPFRWGSTVAPDGTVRIFLHGPGALPDGARPRIVGENLFPEDTWTFLAPDEDLVLCALSLQMNAIFPRLQGVRGSKSKMNACVWQLELTSDDPKASYPIFAHASGTVVGMKSEGVLAAMKPDGIILSEDDRNAINSILARYTGESDSSTTDS